MDQLGQPKDTCLDTGDGSEVDVPNVKRPNNLHTPLET